MGSDQLRVGQDQDTGIGLGLQFQELAALFVHEIGCHLYRYFAVYLGHGIFQGLFMKQAQYMQAGGLAAANLSGTATARAGFGGGLFQAGPQALPRHFQQTKAGDAPHLDAGAVQLQGLLESGFHLALMLGGFHVNEIHHDQAAQVAQTDLSGDLFGRLQVGLQGGFGDVLALGGAAGVDVDGNQGFGVVDDNGAACLQTHIPGEGRFDLLLDLVAGEEGDVVLIAFQTVDHFRHH